MTSPSDYPDYEKLRNDLLEIIKRYKKGEITLRDIQCEASDLDDEYFYDEDPEWDKGNLYSLYSKILFILEVFWWIFPEDIPFIEETLNCKNEDVKECLKKWEDYWQNKDENERYLEGIEKGYWKKWQ